MVYIIDDFQLDHDYWMTFYKHYATRRRAVLADWSRDRVELLNRAVVVFREAVEARARHEDMAMSRKLQEQHCQQLYDKVGYMGMWRDSLRVEEHWS